MSPINRAFRPTALRTMVVVLPLVLFTPLLEASLTMAQSGGGGGGAGGSGGGGSTGGGTSGGGMGGAGPGSAAGTPSTGTTTSPSTRAPATGPQVRSPANSPSTVPQRDTGTTPVPSAGNAEPSSPIYRRDTPPGSLSPHVETTAPQTDQPIGGSGGARAGSGAAGQGDPLAPTDSAGNPALGGSGDEPNSISEEPDRVKRAGAAGRNLDECMTLWDPGTHMTKEQWKTTCERLGR